MTQAWFNRVEPAMLLLFNWWEAIWNTLWGECNLVCSFFNATGSCRGLKEETDKRALSLSDCEGARYIQKRLRSFQTSSVCEQEHAEPRTLKHKTFSKLHTNAFGQNWVFNGFVLENIFEVMCNCLARIFFFLNGLIAEAEAFFPQALTHKYDIDTQWKVSFSLLFLHSTAGEDTRGGEGGGREERRRDGGGRQGVCLRKTGTDKNVAT